MKERFFWADILRVIAIYFVVVIHNSALPQGLNFSGVISYVIFALAKTSIPLFVMLSGALLLGKKEPYALFFKKRVLKVVFPWIAWTFIFMGMGYYLGDFEGTTLSEWKYYFELTLLTKLWFLPLIVSIYLLTPVWRVFIQKSSKIDRVYLTTLFVAFASIFPFLHNSLAFPVDQNGILIQAVLFSGYFLLGYILINDYKKRFSMPLLFTLFSFGISLTFLEIILGKPYELIFSYLSPNVALLSVSLFLIIYKLFIKRKKINAKLTSLVTKMSLASLGIYIIHQPIGQFLDPYLTTFKNGISQLHPSLTGISMGLIYFLITFFVVFLFQKTPLKKILP